MSLRDELIRLFPDLRGLPAETLVVGGAVRDLLLGLAPSDVDLTCDDPLTCARSLRGRVVRLGQEDDLHAYRAIADGRVYDFSMTTPLARRDFTMNAIALDLASDALIDPHGGEADLRAGLVRMIEPKNFDDDPLRTLRGVRMAVKYAFAIDDLTLHAIRERAASIESVAAERVSYELNATFSAGRFRLAILLLHETGLDLVLFGRALDSGTFHADDLSLAGAYALLLGDPRRFAERWRLSDALLHEIVTLQSLRDQHDRLALYDAGESIARGLPSLLRALGRDDCEVITELDSDLFTIRPLLDGEAIAAATGLLPGAELGRVKRKLVEAQVAGGVRTRDEAAAFVRHVART